MSLLLLAGPGAALAAPSARYLAGPHTSLTLLFTTPASTAPSAFVVGRVLANAKIRIRALANSKKRQ